MNHPYPVGTPCIIINTGFKSLEYLIGHYCEIVQPLGLYYVSLPGHLPKQSFGYGILIKGETEECFTQPKNIMPIKPDDDFKKNEEELDDIPEEDLVLA